ncbi:hypothetical protein P20311_1861 [Pseudoalteromonas sp. BSi20311]|nr:hypothetical protein P20311_1861 [Pseudoalteromonas sp. BSi20311]GAA70216.1 hypothetical protein P20439_0280 [Pseudoalteromonas sp. BSi20439]
MQQNELFCRYQLLLELSYTGHGNNPCTRYSSNLYKNNVLS